MNITVYRQAEYNDGTMTVYFGEDSIPVVDDRCLIIADGVGGSMFHKDFNKELFDRERIYQVLFNGLLQSDENSELAEYVRESFIDLYRLKDIYYKDSIYYKKSGYFGSRIVAAIVLHELTVDPDYVNKLFQSLKEMEDEAEKKKFLDRVSNDMVRKIQETLKTVAANARLYYETKMPNCPLLGTTLTVTLFHENEETVEAICFQAGDSRPYYWDKDQGLMQLMKDHENKKKQVTNAIYANENSFFYLETKHFTFDKPCILFNASDGCFDAFSFTASPSMAFEIAILESILGSADENELSNVLREKFSYLSNQDDSSSIAMRTFGIHDFEELKVLAQERLNTITEQYLSKLEGLLEVDYDSLLRNRQSGAEQEILSVKEALWELEEIRAFCRRKALDSNYQNCIRKLAEVDEKQKENEEQIRSAISAAASLIAETDCSSILYAQGRINNKYRNSLYVEITGLRKLISDTIRYYLMETGTMKDVCTELQEKNNDIPVTEDQIFDLDKEVIEELEKIDSFNEYKLHRLKGCYEKMSRIIPILRKQVEKYHKNCAALAETCAEDINEITAALLEGRLDLNSMGLPSNVIECIKSGQKEILGTREQANSSDKEKEVILEETARAYWDDHAVSLIKEIYSGHSDILPGHLYATITKAFENIREQTKKLQEQKDLQQQLVRQYEEQYSTYIGDHK